MSVGVSMPDSAVTPPPHAVLPERHPLAPPPGADLGSHYVRCFGCGADSADGLHLRVTAGDGLSVTARFTVTESHQGAPGLAHGGLLACAFDEAMGSLSWLTRASAVTAALETNFRRPVPVGSTLYITARVDGVAGRKVYLSADGRLNAPDGPVAVRSRALFVRVGLDHFVEHGREQDVRAVTEDPSLIANRNFEVNP